MVILFVQYYWFIETVFQGPNNAKWADPAWASFALSSFNIFIEILLKGVLFKLFFTSLVFSSILQHCALLTCALLTCVLFPPFVLGSLVPAPFCPALFWRWLTSARFARLCWWTPLLMAVKYFCKKLCFRCLKVLWIRSCYVKSFGECDFICSVRYHSFRMGTHSWTKTHGSTSLNKDKREIPQRICFFCWENLTNKKEDKGVFFYFRMKKWTKYF